MKKCFMTMFCLLATVATMTSCKKENNGFVTLNAELENVGNGKVYMDGQLPKWNDGDSVWVNGNGCAISMTTSGASISIPAGQVAPYYAVYPYSSVTGQTSDQITVKIPTTQAWQADASGHQKVSLPMAAYNDGSNQALKFHNLASLVKVTVTNNESSAITLNSVKLTATTSTVYLSGSASIAKSGIGSSPYPALVFASGSNDVILNGINTEITASGSMVVYLVVPTFASTQMKITIYTSAGQQNHTGANSAAMSRNEIAKAGYSTTSDWLSVSSDIEMLSGEFTVNSSGKRVHFSKGNAYCKRSSSSSYDWTWHTESEQYSCQWSGSGSGSTMTNNDTKVSLFRQYFDQVSNWKPLNDGTNTANNKFAEIFEGSWFLLTQAEWRYILFSRATGITISADGIATTNARYMKCKVNDIEGLLIFPDGFNPSNIVVHKSGSYSPVNRENTGSDYSGNNYTGDTWTSLENLGCVFLPAAGYCNGAAGTATTHTVSHNYNIYKDADCSNQINVRSTGVCSSAANINREAIRLVTLGN